MSGGTREENLEFNRKHLEIQYAFRVPRDAGHTVLKVYDIGRAANNSDIVHMVTSDEQCHFLHESQVNGVTPFINKKNSPQPRIE